MIYLTTNSNVLNNDHFIKHIIVVYSKHIKRQSPNRVILLCSRNGN